MHKNVDLVKIVSENIAHYRKKMNLTQLELAEKLNYSDKSISKWERAEGIPSVIVLKEIADFFGVTLNDMIKIKKVKISNNEKNRGFISYFFASIVMVISFIAFGVLKLLDVNYESWKLIIYGLPISSLILFVFYIVWNNARFIYLYLSLFIWTLALSVFVSLEIENKYFVFIITIPVYFITIYLLKLIYLNKHKKI